MRPVVGLTSRTMQLAGTGKTRATETVTRSYVEAVERAGALAVLLPNAEPARAPAYLDLIDGLLLTGGDDPHPRHFGEEPHPLIEAVDDRRDWFELAMVRAAHERGLPVLGLCRGVQMMNIALGGDIYQDIGSQTETTVRHVQTRLDDGPWHEVEIDPGSRLAALLGGGRRPVNSFHHQSCRRLADGLRVSATAVGDGLIEAVEDPERDFFLGVQWHPELAGEAADPLFAAFFEAAREWAAAASKERRSPSSGR